MNFEFKYELLCWDNAGDAGAGDADAGDGGGGGDGAGDGGKEDRTFTQDEVNRFVADRNKALKTKYEEMENSYQDLLSQQNLTNEQRKKLESNLESVRREMLTKEQRLEADKKKAQVEFEAKLDVTSKEANRYKTLYETSTIERAIIDAAKDEAFDSSHFIVHLAPQSKMVEEVDAEGNLTGGLVPRVEWVSVNDEGKKVVSMKTPEEAVKLMKEDKKYACLFKANVSAGIGGGTAPGQGSAGRVDPRRLSTTEYMELAKTPEGRRKLGLIR